ncbi:conserved protein, unknown function [Hepatocystis sp. ex Piliocolobus tephrosceles]|nr:conserved protein, unknown function [Hepatocystis sp. ex Piliocolobus tephrosceles]
MDRFKRNATRRESAIVYAKKTVDKSKVNFIEKECSYNNELLREHANVLNILKNVVVTQITSARKRIVKQLDDLLFFDNKRSRNFDEFYDKCINIIEHYLIVYNEINGIVKSKAKNKRIGNFANPQLISFNKDNGIVNNTYNVNDLNSANGYNGSVNESANESANENANSSDDNKKKMCKKNSNIFYKLVEKNKTIHNNAFLFDYDDDSEIYTSSDEEIVLEINPTSINKLSQDYNKSKKYKKGKKTNKKVVVYDKYTFSKENKDNYIKKHETTNTNYTNRENGVVKKIKLLNRYPLYLRELIHIVKSAKQIEKKALNISFLKKNMLVSSNINKLNSIFEKLYQYNYYLHNKKYVLKKRRRLLYRIIRYNMLNHFYNNHDLIMEQVLKKNNQRFNLSIESIQQIFENNKCTCVYGDNDNINANPILCKMCQTKIKKLFYLICFHNFNYAPIYKNNQINKKLVKPKKLLTHVFMKSNVSSFMSSSNFVGKGKKIGLSNEDSKHINVEYDIQYYEDKYIYIVSQNNIFCHIFHEDYLKNNFNNFVCRIKNGSKGYIPLNLILNKYKNKKFLNSKKIKQLLEYNKTSRKNSNVDISSQLNKLNVNDSFYDTLKTKLKKNGNDTNIFYNDIFTKFYNALHISLGNTQESYLKRFKQDIEYVDFTKDCDYSSDDNSVVLSEIFSKAKQSVDSKENSTNNLNKNHPNHPNHPNKTNHPNHPNKTNHPNHPNKTKDSNNRLTSSPLLLNKINKEYMNLKKMSCIDELFVDENTWENNKHKNYCYLTMHGNNEMDSSDNSGDDSDNMLEKKKKKKKKKNNNLSSFNEYLKEINSEIAIIENSDDSDENLKNNNEKTKKLLKYLKRSPITARNNIVNNMSNNTNLKRSLSRNNTLIISSSTNPNILERRKVHNIKKNMIIHPLINSKNIGFKINVNDIGNRQLDIYCINNNEYVKAYKNTFDYLKNHMNTAIQQKYNTFSSMKKQRINNGLGESSYCDNSKEKEETYYSYINDLNETEKNIKEYIVVIDENIEEEKYKIDIYNYAELDAYIVDSKKEKKKEFYSNFIKNQIYSHKWINKLQFKLQNYNNIYNNSYFKKEHINTVLEKIYTLLNNTYYKNMYDISFNLLSRHNYKHYELSNSYMLTNLNHSINQIYINILNSILNDVINASCVTKSSQYLIELQNIINGNLQLSDLQLHDLQLHDLQLHDIQLHDDKMSSNTIPTDTIPTDTIPTDTIPTDTIPTDTIPTDTIPTDTIPTDTIPTDTMQTDRTSFDNEIPVDSAMSEDIIARNLKFAASIQGTVIIQHQIAEFLLNNKWDKKLNGINMDKNLEQYRFIFLYYLLYVYPKFLHIMKIIKTKNCMEYMKFSIPDNEDQHVHDTQVDYTTQKKTLRDIKKNTIMESMDENKEKVNLNKLFLPSFIKKRTNKKDIFVLNNFLLTNILLVNFSEKLHYELFINVLNDTVSMDAIINEIHPICFKTLYYYKKYSNDNSSSSNDNSSSSNNNNSNSNDNSSNSNDNSSNSNDNNNNSNDNTTNDNSSSSSNNNNLVNCNFTQEQLATLFFILNSYLSFVATPNNIYFNEQNIWKFLIYKNSRKEKNKAQQLILNKGHYFPWNFLNNFLQTFLHKKENKYVYTQQMVVKLMTYILLIQLIITDNKLPIQLAFVNKNMRAILQPLNFAIIDTKFITFNGPSTD